MTASVEARSAARSAAGRGGVAILGLAAAGGVLVTLVLLGITGQLAAVTPALFDPGALVRYGLPAVRTLHDLAAAVSVGALVFAAWLVAPEPGRPREELGGARQWTVRLGARAVLVWLVTSAAVLVLTAADVSGLGVGQPGFGSVLASFSTQVDLGRSMTVSLLLIAVAATVSGLATRSVPAAWAAALAVAAVLPLALGGHAAGSDNHMNSVDSLAFHLVGATLWVGGLITLLLAAPHLGDQRGRVIARYSRLAGWCFVLVAASGVVNALLRLGSLEALTSPYGRLVVAKTAALVVLGGLGALHRRWTLPQLDARPGLFARVAAVEVVVMGATIGLAVALSRSPTPAEGPTLDRVASLLGQPAPAPLTLGHYLTSFHPELLWLTVAVGLAAAYVVGVVRLRRRGDGWPWHRLVAWLAGCLMLVYVTSGGPGVYGRMSFSTHMINHMALMIIVPLLLVLGAPLLLAVRGLRPRTDRSLGPRETLLLLVHAKPLRVLGHPAVAAALFTVGLVIFYYSDLFELAMFTHTGHVLMTAHFLLAGYLFVWSLIGIDPGPPRPAYPFRMIVLLMTLAFHAFFGISLMSSGSVLALDWWHALGQTDDAALLADQQAGGAIAWATGDVPSLLLGLALIVGWVRSDTRAARRSDRQADRDGDAELASYNEQLAAMSRRDRR